MSLWNAIFFWRKPKRKQTVWDSPDHVKCPARYRDAVVQTFYVAATRLRNVGALDGHLTMCREALFVKGTKNRIKGWAVSDGAGGWKGGWADFDYIALATNPYNGDLNPSWPLDLAHEWGHNLLFAAKVPVQKHHEILARAGL